MSVDPAIVHWPTEAEILYFHNVTIELHGGLQGFALGGKGRLTSTLQRPKNLLWYQPDVTLIHLAATLIYGFAKNHCFNDGNKRVSAISGGLFLGANGINWRPSNDDLVTQILTISASVPADQEEQMSKLTSWIRASVITR
ncbi:type II toxin-antitoxin system death-on-curing family toxin [Synechococcus sp. CS-1326]|uniref:type II toxin-antitoxin system death-on-curing family toxin n=1 Tax=Synechococcus sp. CS-1326 TaxID=2847978 RepID=UPI00223B5A31|nr:type II toxin-antitoxin system death-on-curing family toxin [Synechococcus sp. CS-1326]MCT0214365.1 type II toxin-antitoxin system death-on-curing family toxin [Synechococcus sp. CS-1326]